MLLTEAVIILTILFISIYIAFVDIQKNLIYDEAILALSVPAIASFCVWPEIELVSRIAGGLLISGMMLAIAIACPGGFGGGDIKLMVPLGFWLGLSKAVLTGMLAVFIEGVWYCAWCLVWVIKQRRKTIRESRRMTKHQIQRMDESAHIFHMVGTVSGITDHRRKLPFGPALCIGAWVSYLWGDVLWQWLWY